MTGKVQCRAQHGERDGNYASACTYQGLRISRSEKEVARSETLPSSKICRASVLKSDARRSESRGSVLVSASFAERKWVSQELSPMPLSQIFYSLVSGVTERHGRERHGQRTLSRSNDVCSVMSNTIGRSLEGTQRAYDRDICSCFMPFAAGLFPGPCRRGKLTGIDETANGVVPVVCVSPSKMS